MNFQTILKSLQTDLTLTLGLTISTVSSQMVGCGSSDFEMVSETFADDFKYAGKIRVNLSSSDKFMVSAPSTAATVKICAGDPVQQCTNTASFHTLTVDTQTKSSSGMKFFTDSPIALTNNLILTIAAYDQSNVAFDTRTIRFEQVTAPATAPGTSPATVPGTSPVAGTGNQPNTGVIPSNSAAQDDN